jgi:hypothetical protein
MHAMLLLHGMQEDAGKTGTSSWTWAAAVHTDT